MSAFCPKPHACGCVLQLLEYFLCLVHTLCLKVRVYGQCAVYSNLKVCKLCIWNGTAPTVHVLCNARGMIHNGISRNRHVLPILHLWLPSCRFVSSASTSDYSHIRLSLTLARLKSVCVQFCELTNPIVPCLTSIRCMEAFLPSRGKPTGIKGIARVRLSLSSGISAEEVCSPLLSCFMG